MVSSSSASEARATGWAFLGTLPYLKAVSLQEQVRAAVLRGDGRETLLLLEHEPVITLGRNARTANVLTSPGELAKLGIAVVHTSRGGDVTFHGPGQLVGYPVFRLRRGIRAHVSAIAEALVAVLADLGIAAEWRASQPGLWVGNDKISAMGFHIHRRVAIHGFALNASIELDGFRHIMPCGLADAGVTSIARLLGSSPEPKCLAASVAHALERSFGMRMVSISHASSRLQIATGDR